MKLQKSVARGQFTSAGSTWKGTACSRAGQGTRESGFSRGGAACDFTPPKGGLFASCFRAAESRTPPRVRKIVVNDCGYRLAAALWARGLQIPHTLSPRWAQLRTVRNDNFLGSIEDAKRPTE